MTVELNGEPFELASGAVLADAVNQYGLDLKTTAATLNGKMYLWSSFDKISLHEGDRLKLSCIGGW